MHNSPAKTLSMIGGVVTVVSLLTTLVYAQSAKGPGSKPSKENDHAPLVTKDPIVKNAASMIQDGRNIFRYDTYGDEAFWGDALQLHQAIEGSRSAASAPA